MTLHSVNCLSHNELLVLAQHQLLPRQLTTTRKHTTVSRYDTGRLPFAHIEVAQLQPMGWTAEMVAQTYNVSREKQDEYALISHTRATQVPISSYWRKLIFLQSSLGRLSQAVYLQKKSFQSRYADLSSLWTTLFVPG